MLGKPWASALRLILQTLIFSFDKALGFGKSEFATPELDIRFAVIRRFNYVVHFLVEADEVQILSVAHGARKPGYWLRRSKK